MSLTRQAPVLPARARNYNAGSAVPVQYQAVDEELVPFTPAAIRYRVDNLTDSVVIQQWTAITPAAQSGTVTISAALNQMSRTWRQRQFNQVTFEFTDDAGNVTQVLRSYWLNTVFQGAT